MDARLLEASQTGDVQILHQLLAENPLLLQSLALTSTENPLHVASIAGHVDFVKEIVKLKPAFVKEMNQYGFSPMHMASANGDLEMVRELLKVIPSLCRLQGRDQWTPLHFVAARGRGDVAGEMVLACPECVEDETVNGETALHLAVMNSQFDAIQVLVERVMQLRKMNVLNMKDKLGNSALHLAAWKKQHQVVEWLVGINGAIPGALEVNIVNQSSLTPLDLLLLFPSEAGDRDIFNTLHDAGALKARDVPHSSVPSTSNPPHQLRHPNNLIKYFNFKRGRDSPSDARTALLVVAVLVATATFQVGINPPSGVWQDSDMGNNRTAGNGPARVAGKSIMGTNNAAGFVALVAFNSIGFSVSLYMINVLTSNFPLQLEIQICSVAFYSTYNTALINISPNNTSLIVIVLTSVLPACVTVSVRCVCYLIMRLRQRPWCTSIVPC